MKISNSNVANTVHKRISRNNILLFSALLAGAVLSGCGGGGGGSGASDVPVQQTKAIVGQPGSEGYALNSAEIGRLYGPGIFRQDALGNTMIGINGSQERIVSNRFRATISGNLASARLYWQPGTGYSRATAASSVFACCPTTARMPMHPTCRPRRWPRQSSRRVRPPRGIAPSLPTARSPVSSRWWPARSTIW